MVGDIRHLVVTPTYAYWIPSSVNVLYRASLDRQDEVLETPLLAPIVECIELENDHLVLLFAEDEGVRAAVLNQKTMEYDKNHALAGLKIPRYYERGPDKFQSMGDGEYYLADRVISKADGSLKCFVEQIPGVVELTPSKTRLPRTVNVTGENFWRRKFSANGVTKDTGPLLFNWGSPVWDVAQTRPLAASLVANRNRPNSQFQIVVRELVFGRIVLSEPFRNVLDEKGQPQGFPRLKFAGDDLVFSVGEEVRWLQLDDTKLSDVVEPLRLLHPAMPTRGIGELQRYPLQVRGGSGESTISLSVETPHVRVDNKAQMLVIDWPALWEEFLASTKKGGEYQLMNADSRTKQGKAFWDYYQIPRGAELTEELASHTVVAVSMAVRVADESGQDDTIAMAALAIAPKEPLTKAFEEGKKVIAARYEQEYTERMPRPAPASQELSERVIRIEERLERIEKLLQRIADEGESKGAK